MRAHLHLRLATRLGFSDDDIGDVYLRMTVDFIVVLIVFPNSLKEKAVHTSRKSLQRLSLGYVSNACSCDCSVWIASIFLEDIRGRSALAGGELSCRAERSKEGLAASRLVKLKN